MWRINHAHTDHSAPGTAQGHRLIHNGYSSSMHAHESTGNDHVVKQCCIACSPLAVFPCVVELCVCMWSHVMLRSLHMCSDKESKDAAPRLSMNAPQTGRSTRQNEEAFPRLCRDKTGAYERGDSLLKTFASFRFLAPESRGLSAHLAWSPTSTRPRHPCGRCANVCARYRSKQHASREPLSASEALRCI